MTHPVMLLGGRMTHAPDPATGGPSRTWYARDGVGQRLGKVG